MRSLFIIAHLKTTGEEARKKVIDMLVKTADYSAAKEPGVTQFCIALPREDDGTSVYAIEESLSHNSRLNAKKLTHLQICKSICFQ